MLCLQIPYFANELRYRNETKKSFTGFSLFRSECISSKNPLFFLWSQRSLFVQDLNVNENFDSSVTFCKLHRFIARKLENIVRAANQYSVVIDFFVREINAIKMNCTKFSFQLKSPLPDKEIVLK